jgi:hypothetical protein
MSKRKRKYEHHYPGDFIGIAEWQLMRVLADEEAVNEQSSLIERINHRPFRTEVLA